MACLGNVRASGQALHDALKSVDFLNSQTSDTEACRLRMRRLRIGEHQFGVGMARQTAPHRETRWIAPVERQPIGWVRLDRVLPLQTCSMDAVALPSAPATTWQDARPQALPLARTKIVSLAIATILSLGLRIGALSSYGFS